MKLHEPNYILGFIGVLVGVVASIALDLWSSSILSYLMAFLFVVCSGCLFAALWMRRVEFHDGVITIQRSVLGVPVGSERTVAYDRREFACRIRAAKRLCLRIKRCRPLTAGRGWQSDHLVSTAYARSNDAFARSHHQSAAAWPDRVVRVERAPRFR